MRARVMQGRARAGEQHCTAHLRRRRARLWLCSDRSAIAEGLRFCRFWRYQDDIPTPSAAAKHPLAAAQGDAATLAAAGILR